jgi:hypothetical protein
VFTGGIGVDIYYYSIVTVQGDIVSPVGSYMFYSSTLVDVATFMCVSAIQQVRRTTMCLPFIIRLVLL